MSADSGSLGTRTLAELRASPAAREKVRFQGTGDGEEWRDLNSTLRHQVLVALQYDWKQADHDLVRYLMEQEIAFHRGSSSQGLFDSLKLAGFLLSKFEDVHDVFLLWEAKVANFDTQCGFDVEYVLSAGVEKTVPFLRASGEPHTEAARRLLDYIEDHGRDESSTYDLAEWRSSKADEFPTSEAAEAPLALVERYIEFGDMTRARVMLDSWVASEPATSAGKLSTLRYYREELGQLDEAVACAEEELRRAKGEAWHWASASGTLAKLLTKAGRFDEALRTLALSGLESVEGWKEVGLGRNTIETGIDLCLACTDAALSARAFEWAHGLLSQGSSYSLNLLEKAVRATEKLQRAQDRQRYSALAEKERRRIKRELDR